MKNSFPIWLFLLFILACSAATASPCESKTTAEFWAEEKSKVAGLDIAYTGCPNWFTGARVGASYYVDDEFLYKGVTGSLRLQYGDVVSPYVGLGLLLGFAEKEVDASADGLDNNQNGMVDEFNEKKTLSATSGFIYPEIGIALNTPGVGITLAVRRYYGSEFSGNLIYSVGIAFALE